MSDFQNGPQNLGNLFRHIKGHVDAGKVMIGKAVKRKADYPPTKFCPICGVVHSPSCIAGDHSMTSKVCEKCQKVLDEAYIALVCEKDRRYAFVLSEALAGCGPIIQISPEVMDKVVAQHKVTPSQGQEPPTPSNN